MTDQFDDTRLDDPAVLDGADDLLRELAGAGARVRAEIDAAGPALAGLSPESGFRPRAVVAAGRDARLVRAVLEPFCPVPFVAWPGPGLPGWAGALDLVVVLAGTRLDTGAASAVAEAVRRGCGLLVAAAESSEIGELAAASRHAVRLPSQSDDALATAVAVLQALHQLELGPAVEAAAVADTLDEVAVACSPQLDISSNPAKDLALVLADALPLIWGGSVLAARAARRVVEAIRLASGRPALAADAEHLFPVLSSQQPRDLFADPFDTAEQFRPGLVILDDGADTPQVVDTRKRLMETAEQHDVRVHVLGHAVGTDITRYAALMHHGRYAAAYLGVGLGIYGSRAISGEGRDRLDDRNGGNGGPW